MLSHSDAGILTAFIGMLLADWHLDGDNALIKTPTILLLSVIKVFFFLFKVIPKVYLGERGAHCIFNQPKLPIFRLIPFDMHRVNRVKS